MTPDFDAVVVGAGVIGLATARALCLTGKSVLVVEKAARVGTETSTRNSEVIHAGIYYPKDSLKAKFCVEGREMIYDYCERHGVTTKRIGKLIIATTAEEEIKLQSIKQCAEDNGVRNLVWMEKSEVAEFEPELNCVRALFSPSTGIIDAGGFVLSLQGDAENGGVVFAFNTCFLSAKRRNGTFVIVTNDSSGDEAEISSLRVYNCAGHGAHNVAANIESFPRTVLPPQFFAKGTYCSVSGKSPFVHLVYPVPVQGALGTHATLDMAGTVRFGPDIQWINNLDYSLSDGIADSFKSAVGKYWPGVRDRKLTPTYCGVRPKIHGPESSFADFVIQDEFDHGIKGLINLFGIESPGLTGSLAIAQHITREG